MQPEQPIASPRTKVSLNPFGHFIQGNKNLFSTNAVPAILASVLSVILSFTISLLSLFILGSVLKNNPTSNFGSDIVSLLVKFLLFILVSILISGYFYEIVARTILTGTRREKVSFGSLFSFVAKRYLSTILAFLMIGGIALAVFAAVALAATISPILGIVGWLAATIFVIVFALRMSYVPLIAVDDEKPESARWMLKRSAQLWKKSGGALVLYFLTLLIISIVISVLTKSDSSTTSSLSGGIQPSSAFGGGSAIAYGSLVVAALIEGIFSLLMVAAIGNIYNQAKQIVDGNSPISAAMPTPPDTLMPTMPTTPAATPLPPPPTTPQPSTDIDPNASPTTKP